MPGAGWSRENIVKFRRRFLRKFRKVLVIANIFLLLVTHCYQSMAKDATDVFKGRGTIKWIYYAFEVLYIVTHLIVSMELSSRSTFWHAKTIFGTLGFEILLWVIVWHHAWFIINVVIFTVALLCALGQEFLHIQMTDIHKLDHGPILEVPLNLSGNGSTGNGFDATDAI